MLYNLNLATGIIKAAMAVSLLLFLTMLHGCGITRKVKKSESHVDSTVNRGIDTSAIRKMLESNLSYKTTTKETFTPYFYPQPAASTGQANPINVYPAGPTVYMPAQNGAGSGVWTKETIAELLQSARQEEESKKGIDTTDAKLTKAQSAKDVKETFGLTGFQQMLLWMAVAGFGIWYIGHRIGKISIVQQVLKK